MEQKQYFSPDGKLNGWFEPGKQPEGWGFEPVDVDKPEDDLEEEQADDLNAPITEGIALDVGDAESDSAQ